MRLWRRMAVAFGIMTSVSLIAGAGVITVLAGIGQEVSEGYGSTVLDAPGKAWWSGTVVGSWKSAKTAKQYQVKLYEYGGSESAIATVKVSATSYDFSEEMEDGKQYYFMVRSIPKISETQAKTGSSWTISEEGGPVTLGDTGGTWRCFLEGNRYQKEDRNYALGWLMIRGSWYYFDEAGYAVVNTWMEWDGYRYYLAENGSAQKDWLEWNGDWYYFNREGQMQTGWVNGNLPTEKYYLYPDGTMAHDTVVDGCSLGSGGLAE